jgi:26S proteasome regulatory subunit N2
MALRLGLESGEYFTGNDVYMSKMMDVAISEYVKNKISGSVYDKLQRLVNDQFDKCFETKSFREALGVAYEARELERVKQVLEKCGGDVTVLQYAVDTAELVDKSFRSQALRCVGSAIETRLSTGAEKRQLYCLYIKTMQLLRSSAEVSQTLITLLSSPHDELLGYQLCFDLLDSGDAQFVSSVASNIPSTYVRAHRILTEGFCSELHLSFLYKRSQTDPLIMSTLKKALEERSGGLGRNSVLHNAAVCCNGYLNLGTTGDGFLRDNLEWMKKASNWCVVCFEG